VTDDIEEIGPDLIGFHAREQVKERTSYGARLSSQRVVRTL
jgi:hypothetical protein